MNFLKLGFFGFLVVLVFGLGMYIGNPFEEAPKQPPPDTVQVEEKVPKIVKDTVEVEVPKTVTEYKTITDTVVKRIPVPTEMNVRGVLPQNFLERGDEQFSVTYFDQNQLQYRTETYDLIGPKNSVELGITGFGTSRLLFSGPHLEYERENWELRAGYGFGVTRRGFYRSTFFDLSIRITGYDF